MTSWSRADFAEASRKWRAAHPERAKAAWQRWYHKHRDVILRKKKERRKLFPEKLKAEHRKANLKKYYGITPEEHQRMVASQDGMCLICLEKPRRLNVDHDHTTGKIRGMLCTTCNSGLGHFKDNPALLRLAIEYLEA
jgi:hypothetical protein